MSDVRLLEEATRFIEGLGPTDQNDVLGILAAIAADPDYDGRSKFPFPLPGATLSLFDSPLFWVVYDVVDDRTIQILNIGHTRDI